MDKRFWSALSSSPYLWPLPQAYYARKAPAPWLRPESNRSWNCLQVDLPVSHGRIPCPTSAQNVRFIASIANSQLTVSWQRNGACPTVLRAPQHSTTLTASPPFDVSPYLRRACRGPFAASSRSPCRGSPTCVPSPIIAMRLASIALIAPIALRSMHGIWTSPPIGSQVRPRLCSMPISAAFSTCALVPPSAAVSPAAAIEQATPTSP